MKQWIIKYKIASAIMGGLVFFWICNTHISSHCGMFGVDMGYGVMVEQFPVPGCAIICTDGGCKVNDNIRLSEFAFNLACH